MSAPRLLALAALALAAGCQSVPADAPRASATLQPTKGSTVRGTAEFVQVGDKVRVTADVSGLKPNGQYGFHIHEAGDCSSGDGMSANPGERHPAGPPRPPRAHPDQRQNLRPPHPLGRRIMAGPPGRVAQTDAGMTTSMRVAGGWD